MSLPPPPKAVNDHGKNDELASELQDAFSVKSDEKPDDSLNAAFSGAIRAPSPDPSVHSIDNSHNARVGRNPNYLPVPDGRRHASRSPGPPRTWKGKAKLFWVTNKGLALVLLSQLFGTLMNVTTRMLEIEGNNGRLHSLSSIRALQAKRRTYRTRLPSFPDPLCANGNYSHLLIDLYVACKDRALPVRHEGSPPVADSSWFDRLLWSLWDVL